MAERKTPELRFEGFDDDWEEKKLGEISEKVTEKNTGFKYSSTFTNSAEFGVIDQADFFDNQIANKNNIDGYYVIKPDEFVYNPRISVTAPVGPINRNKLGRIGVMSPLYYVFKVADIDLTFLEHFFKTPKWYPFMFLNGNSGARSDRFSISDNVFAQLPIQSPKSESEQQHIGSFFKNLDQQILLTQEKLDKTKTLKKTMLQKMFPQEGSKVPEIRLEGFSGDWEEKPLNNYLDVSNEVNSEEKYGKKDVLSVSGDYGVVNQIEFQGRSFAGASVSNYGVVQTGDVVYTKSPLRWQPYGIIKTNKGVPGIVSVLYGVYHPKENLYSNFVQNYFESDNRLNEYLRVLVNKGAKNTLLISDEDALKGIVKFPSFEEQKAISNFFDNLSEMITTQSQKIDLLKTLKKSLLEKMFV